MYVESYLVFNHPLRSNDLLKDVFSDVRVYCTEWVIQQVDICLLVDSTGQTHTLFLTSTEVNTL